MKYFYQEGISVKQSVMLIYLDILAHVVNFH